MLHDRDAKFGVTIDEILRCVGIEPIVLPPRSPNPSEALDREQSKPPQAAWRPSFERSHLCARQKPPTMAWARRGVSSWPPGKSNTLRHLVLSVACRMSRRTLSHVRRGSCCRSMSHHPLGCDRCDTLRRLGEASAARVFAIRGFETFWPVALSSIGRF